MRIKLIATAISAAGVGALVAWGATSDFYEAKMKRNQKLLGEIITRKDETIEGLMRAQSVTVNQYISTPAVDEEEAEEAPEEIVSATPFNAFKDSVNPDEVGAPIPSPVRNSDGQKVAYNKVPDVPEGETEEETRSRLQGMIDTYTNNEEDRDAFVDLGARAVVDTATPPFVISRAKYSWDEEEGDEYEKITLTWYPRERTLLDDQDEPVDDVDSLIGWRSLDRFGDESEDPNVVFVRNRKMETDFEVVRDSENQLPAHVRYGMAREEFNTNKAAGLIRFRPEDT